MAVKCYDVSNETTLDSKFAEEIHASYVWLTNK